MLTQECTVGQRGAPALLDVAPEERMGWERVDAPEVEAPEVEASEFEVAGLGLVGTASVGCGTVEPLGEPVVPEARVGVRVKNKFGAIHRSDARVVAQEHRNERRYCYRQAIALGAQFEGSMDFKVAVDSRGHVFEAFATEYRTVSGKLGRCMAGAMKRWPMPKPRRDHSIVVFRIDTKKK
jgi:hypothetical protein